MHEKRAEVSIRWRTVCWFGFLLSSCFVSSGYALIGSSSPVSRSSSSSNYILFSPPSVLCLLAFLLLFWLGSATGHSPHTPTTTPFQYTQWSRLGGVHSVEYSLSQCLLLSNFYISPSQCLPLSMSFLCNVSSQYHPLLMSFLLVSPLLNILPSQCLPNVFPSQCPPLSLSSLLNISLSQCPLLLIPSSLNVVPSQCPPLSISSPLNVLSSQYLSSQFLPLQMTSPSLKPQFLSLLISFVGAGPKVI